VEMRIIPIDSEVVSKHDVSAVQKIPFGSSEKYLLEVCPAAEIKAYRILINILILAE